MKTEKLNLKSIKNVLSRTEMKNIMAGSGGHCCMHNSDWNANSTQCGLSMSYASSNFASMGYSNWCCSSCISSLGV